MTHNNPLKIIIISNRLYREEKTGIPTELGAWPVEETSWYLPGIIGIIIIIHFESIFVFPAKPFNDEF